MSRDFRGTDDTLSIDPDQPPIPDGFSLYWSEASTTLGNASYGAEWTCRLTPDELTRLFQGASPYDVQPHHLLRVWPKD